MEHDEGHFEGAGGLSLYYQRWRPETRPARAIIVMVHGDFAHSGWYMNLPDHEVPRRYAVYAFDRRGWGRSPGQRGYLHSWSENLDDLAAFLQWMRAEEADRPIFLMGITGSAPILLEYAILHPQEVRGVCCISPVLDMSAVAPAVLRRLIHILARIRPQFTIDVRRQFDAGVVTVSHDPAFVKLMREDPLGNTKVTPRWFVESEKAMRRVTTQAASFPVPLLMLIGEADRTSSPGTNKAFFQQVVLPDKQLHEYAGGYTNLLCDSVSEAVFSDIDQWLDQHV